MKINAVAVRNTLQEKSEGDPTYFDYSVGVRYKAVQMSSLPFHACRPSPLPWLDAAQLSLGGAEGSSATEHPPSPPLTPQTEIPTTERENW